MTISDKKALKLADITRAIARGVKPFDPHEQSQWVEAFESVLAKLPNESLDELAQLIRTCPRVIAL